MFFATCHHAGEELHVNEFGHESFGHMFSKRWTLWHVLLSCRTLRHGGRYPAEAGCTQLCKGVKPQLRHSMLAKQESTSGSRSRGLFSNDTCSSSFGLWISITSFTQPKLPREISWSNGFSGLHDRSHATCYMLFLQMRDAKSTASKRKVTLHEWHFKLWLCLLFFLTHWSVWGAS